MIGGSLFYDFARLGPTPAPFQSCVLSAGVVTDYVYGAGMHWQGGCGGFPCDGSGSLNEWNVIGELKAATPLGQAGRYPPVGVRPARSQRPRSSSAAAGEAPGAPAGPPGALRLPSNLSVRTIQDGLALPRVAEERGLEGIVSKRRDAPYRSGECRDWRKVKTVAWREASKKRWRLFERA